MQLHYDEGVLKLLMRYQLYFKLIEKTAQQMGSITMMKVAKCEKDPSLHNFRKKVPDYVNKELINQN